MARRLQPTVFDYMVVAINPALIIVLIGSLVYFLLEMFYQGQYPARLHYCLTLFIFAAVLVARISMEEGWEHAAPFGMALAVAICLALHRFVSYEGTNLVEIGWLINYGLIALAWWCAHQLTWDCTVLDESKDASGEGLLQTVGLDTQAAEQETSKKTSPSDQQSGKTAPAKASDHAFTDDLSWSVRKSKSDESESSWQRFLQRRRRPHAPGVWVVYFSLAALPLFGFGQAFIPVANTESRRYAFLLLCVYAASALGLLLTTSFLGLRRYLRQRRLEMPLSMAGTWLTTGAVLIVCLLLLAALVPRPNAEYAISELAVSLKSVEHEASKVSAGKEGTKDDQAENRSGTPRKDDQSPQDDETQKNNGKSSNGESKGDGKGESEAKGSQKNGKESKGDSQGNDSKDGDSKTKSSDGETSGGEKSQSQSSDGQPKSETESNDTQAPPKPVESPEASPPEVPQLPLSGLLTLFKWVFYGVVILIALWWSWRHRAELLAWLVALLTGWRDFWGLFGRRKPKAIKAAKPIRHKSFLDFTDPFAAGIAGQYSPEELVRYTFEAFEAWARNNGFPRGADQTAHEFARQVASRAEHLAMPARKLAELYSIAAYAPGTLPPSSPEHLRAFWQALRSESVVA